MYNRLEMYGRFDWMYLELIEGRLIDHDTHAEANPDLPSFSSIAEAETYLEDNDIRATIIN